MSKRLDSTPLSASELDQLLELVSIAHDRLMIWKHDHIALNIGVSDICSDYARIANRLILRLKLIRKDTV